MLTFKIFGGELKVLWQGKQANRIGRWTLALATVAAPMCLGGVPNWVGFVVAPLVLVALAFALEGRQSIRMPWVGIAVLAMATFCAFQLLPLPQVLLKIANPFGHYLSEFALEPLGLGRLRPISVEPAATSRELGKHLTYLAAFLAAFHLSLGARKTPQVLLGTIAATGAVEVLLAGIHPLFQLEGPFGLYKFQATPRLMTTFANINHLAGFCLMSGLLALGLAIETDRRRARFIWLGVFCVCAVGVLLSLSRGGIAAFTLGLLMLLLNLLRNHLKAPRSERAAGLAVGARWAGVALAFVAIASVFMADRLVRRFSEATSYRLKLNIWPSAIDAFADFWRTGMGRGAFEVAFTRFMPDHLGKTYTHPENFILQLMTEMGFISLPLILLAGFALFQQWRGAVKSPTNLSVISAALALAVHNLFDFNLEYWGVALPLFVALGVSAATNEKAWVFKIPIKPFAYVAAGVLAVALYFGNDNLREQESELVAFYRASNSSVEVQTKALALIDRHPANYLPYTIAGASWVEKQPIDPNQAIAFTNRSLYLFPRDFVAHQVTAKALRRLGKRSQALLEYRLSYESAFDAPAILDECAQFGQNATELLECVPARVVHVSALIRSAARHHPNETADACIEALRDLPLEDSTPTLAAQCAKHLLSVGRRDDASALLDSVAQKMKDPSELAIGRAEVLCERSLCDQGIALLEEALQKSPTHYEITKELASRYIQQKRYEAARAIVVRTAAVTVDTPRRAALKVVEGDVDSALGAWERAVSAFRVASSLEPTSDRHYKVSEALMRLRRVDDAWAELRAGQRLDSQAGAEAAEQRLKQLQPSVSVKKER